MQNNFLDNLKSISIPIEKNIKIFDVKIGLRIKNTIYYKIAQGLEQT